MFPILKVPAGEKMEIYSLEEWVDGGGHERAWRILLTTARNPKEALVALLREEVVEELYRHIPMAVNHPGRLYVSRQEVQEDALTAWVGYRDPDEYGPVTVHCTGIGRAFRDAKRKIVPLEVMRELVERSNIQLARTMRVSPSLLEGYRLTRSAVIHRLYERRVECEQAVIELLALQNFDRQIGDLPVLPEHGYSAIIPKGTKKRIFWNYEISGL